MAQDFTTFANQTPLENTPPRSGSLEHLFVPSQLGIRTGGGAATDGSLNGEVVPLHPRLHPTPCVERYGLDRGVNTMASSNSQVLRAILAMRRCLRLAIFASVLVLVTGCGDEGSVRSHTELHREPVAGSNAVSGGGRAVAPEPGTWQSQIIPADDSLIRAIDDARLIPEPTAEQVKAWEPPDYASLELLSVKEVPTIDFLIPHPDQLRYLAAGVGNLSLWHGAQTEPVRLYTDPTNSKTRITAAAFSQDGTGSLPVMMADD
ncbi:hypothetical protein [Fuerstiella marisgermanici]|uniref:Uncharacterized protein n=1 Tax=Fuerstiella marisgermanici TaxID=1891926 RepID=A0A1P8WMW9_9PLAN|nr:hypothetical protein [Fuerstiella marisgermanici]APZ95381.1 hypothetical protein Fuma_05039 [Fuerstiella marisgermanici]